MTIALILERLRRALAALAGSRSTVHRCPPVDMNVTPCCGRTPFELPISDRMTVRGRVTCKGASR